MVVSLLLGERWGGGDRTGGGGEEGGLCGQGAAVGRHAVVLRLRWRLARDTLRRGTRGQHTQYREIKSSASIKQTTLVTKGVFSDPVTCTKT